MVHLLSRSRRSSPLAQEQRPVRRMPLCSSSSSRRRGPRLASFRLPQRRPALARRSRVQAIAYWKTERSLFKFGWSTPVHWRHDGIDEIVVLGGDFKPDQRLMAYSLVDGTERWWVGGLPPCGKSTPVIGGGLLFLAAPDIILETSAERRNPERAAQFYANNMA